MNDLATHAEPQIGQYLGFRLAGEEYAINILEVQEIKGCQPVTRIPNAPAHVRGVINLRGLVVPVMDMRSRFGMPRREDDPGTVVIVVRVRLADGTRTIGLVVDAVTSVHELDKAGLQAAPDLGAGVDADFIEGLVPLPEGMCILLDLPTLVRDGLLQAGSPVEAIAVDA
ncbi:MAG: purine-binding chemotaxis protein CheW [Chromatiales bacterium]|nr:purine-binding chemotaxis protein CheW [Gammaproteobacteria bacterium]MCP5352726.1 purine-binding chemotaxis protein CheW [Chromatiales bacterium]